MTEDEAETKWCFKSFADARGPVQWGDGTAGGYSPAVHTGFRMKCCASKCMAWRWEKEMGVSGDGNSFWERSSRTSGYCGLAGKP